MKRYERLEEFLFHTQLAGQTQFTHSDVVEWFGTTNNRASEMIAAYQKETRRDDSGALYFLYRTPGTRTSNAEWNVGIRADDATDAMMGMALDLRHRIKEFGVPAMAHIADRNPQAVKRAEGCLLQMQGLLTFMESLTGT